MNEAIKYDTNAMRTIEIHVVLVTALLCYHSFTYGVILYPSATWHIHNANSSLFRDGKGAIPVIHD